MIQYEIHAATPIIFVTFITVIFAAYAVFTTAI